VCVLESLENIYIYTYKKSKTTKTDKTAKIAVKPSTTATYNNTFEKTVKKT